MIDGIVFFSSCLLSGEIHGRCGAFVAETEFVDRGRDAGGYACFDGAVVQPALVEGVVVEGVCRRGTFHVVVEGELVHEAVVGFGEGAGCADEVEGGLRGEGGVGGEVVGD